MTENGDHDGPVTWLVDYPIGALFTAVPFVVTSYWLGRILVGVADPFGLRPDLVWCFLAVLTVEVVGIAILIVHGRRRDHQAG